MDAGRRRVVGGVLVLLGGLVGACSAPAVAAEPLRPAPVPGRGLVACRLQDIPATSVRDEKATRLAIAPRRHADGHPPEGWCGETAIQEALLHHGIFCPQRQINAAGRPRHPDLYASEVPVALRNLGMQIRIWPDGTPQPDLDGFLGWVRGRIDAGVPVLCGVKINPTQHPNWSLDHFVLAVGHTKEALALNTTWGNCIARTDKQLRSTSEKGFALANRYRSYYGIAVVGPANRPADSVPVRLFAQREEKQRMAVIVKCEGLQPGTRYAVYRLTSREEKAPAAIHRFEASGPVAGFHDLIGKDRTAIYRCRPLAAGR